MGTTVVGDLNVHHSGTIAGGESVPPQSYDILRQGGLRSAALEVLLGYILIGQGHINVSTLNPTGYMST